MRALGPSLAYLERWPARRRKGSAVGTKIAHENCWQQQHESMQRPKNSMHMRRASLCSR